VSGYAACVTRFAKEEMMWSCHSTRRDVYVGPRVTKTLGTRPRLNKSQPTNGHCGVLCRRHTRMRGSLELVGKQLQGMRDYGTTSHQSTLLSACGCCEMTLVSMAVLMSTTQSGPCSLPATFETAAPQTDACGSPPTAGPASLTLLVRKDAVSFARALIRACASRMCSGDKDADPSPRPPGGENTVGAIE